jgi:predicted ArsR family transcriptional regulator
MIKGSKKQLLDLIKKYGRLSIDEATNRTDLAKTTLREHFLQLENDGYVERYFERNGPGRPSLQFELTSKGHNLYPSYESKLARQFIRFLKEQDEEDKIEEFFEEFWDERYQKASGRMNQHSNDQPEKQLKALIAMLDEEGFMPEMDFNKDSETLTIKECNCPFSEVVKETRLPCKLEALFYKKLFGEEAERKTHIAKGDYSCTYEIPRRSFSQ